MILKKPKKLTDSKIKAIKRKEGTLMALNNAYSHGIVVVLLLYLLLEPSDNEIIHLKLTKVVSKRLDFNSSFA